MNTKNDVLILVKPFMKSPNMYLMNKDVVEKDSGATRGSWFGSMKEAISKGAKKLVSKVTKGAAEVKPENDSPDTTFLSSCF